VTAIEPKWLTEVAPTFFKVADAHKLSKRKKQEKIAPLFDRYAKSQDDWVGLVVSVSSLRRGADLWDLRIAYFQGQTVVEEFSDVWLIARFILYPAIARDLHYRIIHSGVGKLILRSVEHSFVSPRSLHFDMSSILSRAAESFKNTIWRTQKDAEPEVHVAKLLVHPIKCALAATQRCSNSPKLT
jgi:hypothetical protein